ncbi:MAG: molybdopterin dinucleotide binding domain-containing protein [Candidatus Odinarchaeota archaeon]
MEMIANTMRMVDNDQAREYAFGDTNSLKEKLGIGFINPTDSKELNLKSGLNIRLKNNFGSVVLKPKEDEDVPVGTIIIPVSIWANQITRIENNEPIYKNIRVNVEVTSDSVLGINDILSRFKK